MTGVDKEKLIEKVKAENARNAGGRQNRFGQAPGLSVQLKDYTPVFESGSQSLTQKAITDNYFIVETKDPEQIIAEAIESQKTSQLDDSESRDANAAQNKKKNKKKGKK